MHERFSLIESYAVFDKTLIVLSEVPEMATHIHCFMKTLRQDSIPSRDSNVRFAVFPAPGRFVALCSPELGLAKCLPLMRPAWVAFRRVFLAMLCDNNSFYHITHASCVADKTGRAALFVGPSNSGKTSLLLALLQRGYRMVTDDYAVIRTSDCSVSALPVGVTVTSHTIDMFPEIAPLKLQPCQFYSEGQWQWTLNPSDIYPTACPSESFAPSHLFFLDGQFGRQSTVAACRVDEAMWMLRRNQLNNRGPRAAWQDDFQTIAKPLMATASFHRVTQGSVQQTADQIAHIFASS